jgi:hypothetical protein
MEVQYLLSVFQEFSSLFQVHTFLLEEENI